MLGNVDGKPAGNGRTLGNGGSVLGRVEGNTNGGGGAGPASSALGAVGCPDGDGRVVVGGGEGRFGNSDGMSAAGCCWAVWVEVLAVATPVPVSAPVAVGSVDWGC
jgi:hypothetical protein